jgi:integrase
MMLARRACELLHEYLAARGPLPTSLTRTDLEGFADWARRSLSEQTVYAYWRSLKRCFNLALDWYPDMKMPALKARWRSKGRPLPAVLDGLEVTRLLDTISVPWLADMVHLVLMTGMRLGEVCSLQWADVDLRARLIRIRSKGPIGANGWHPKAGVDSDVIALADDAIVLLGRLPRSSLYVFPAENGEARYASYVSKFFKIQIRRAGFEPRIHFHTLRHTFATLLLRSGVGIYEVSKLMRHRSVTTTQMYVHILSSELHESVNRLKIDRPVRGARL